jgi:hypothetical protein
MRRRGRDDLKTTLLLQLPEHAEQVPIPFEEILPAARKVRLIKLRESAPLIIFAVPLDFTPG